MKWLTRSIFCGVSFVCMCVPGELYTDTGMVENCAVLFRICRRKGTYGYSAADVVKRQDVLIGMN